ncbi:hypothetical protein BDQ17DRAFT_1429258 [Cyathus striatus]|nr:hypothetical protein BDQ17DRAFT_1429258 [Cyathus striatus]
MYGNNPYAQGGWKSPQGNQYLNQQGQYLYIPPSIFGALPSAAPTARSEFLTFYFTAFNPTILNCIVIGPSRSYIDVVTSPGNPESTILRGSNNDALGIIEWHQSPFVEVTGALSRRTTRDFLILSPDRSFRTMHFRGKQYAWVPSNNNTILLYNISCNPSELLGRIVRSQDAVNLQITASTIHEGLMETCIIATLLLTCGRNLD